MIRDLELLAGCSEPWASQRAGMAIDIVLLRDRGEISQSEAAELLEDLVRMDRLDAEATDLELKTMLVQAVYVAAKMI
jgi:hypothetical protein